MFVYGPNMRIRECLVKSRVQKPGDRTHCPTKANATLTERARSGGGDRFVLRRMGVGDCDDALVAGT